VSSEFDLIINNSKCGIMPLKYEKNNESKLKDRLIEGISYVFTYKFLGITIDSNGSIA